MLQFYDSSTFVCFLNRCILSSFQREPATTLSSRKLSVTVRLLLLKKVLFSLYKATLQICTYCYYHYTDLSILCHTSECNRLLEKRAGSVLFGQINASLQEQNIGEVLHMSPDRSHFTIISSYDILNMHLLGKKKISK